VEADSCRSVDCDLAAIHRKVLQARPLHSFPQPMGPGEISDAVDRLKGTFLEMPGTKLTVQQASRLCGLDASACGIILEVLRDTGFLTTRPDGTFMRAESEQPSRERPGRAYSR
jgi:hypothetical protein